MLDLSYIDTRPGAVAARSARAQRTRCLGRTNGYFFTAERIARIRAMTAETPTERRRYAVAALAAMLKRSEPAIMRLVTRGKIPAPDRITGDRPSWAASILEPWLQRRGIEPPNLRRESALAKDDYAATFQEVYGPRRRRKHRAAETSAEPVSNTDTGTCARSPAKIGCPEICDNR